MTISSTTARKTYNGDGSTTAFSTVFKFLQNSHVQVILRASDGTETTWTEGTQYTLTGAGEDSGGTVTVDTSPTDYTPQTGETLAIIRVAPNTQGSTLPLGGAFPSTTVEQALDLAAMRDQQLSEKLDRSLFFPVSDPVGIGAGLPNDTDRAGKFLAFDSSGAPVVTAGTADATPHNAFMVELHGAADAAAARTVLGAPGTAGDGIAISSDTISLDINSLSEDTTPDVAAVFLLAYDTSASTAKKVKPQNIVTRPTRQVFTADGTWTKPANCKKVLVRVQGGGGGGGGGSGASSRAGGGGAGGYCEELIDVSAIASETVTVGVGGTAGTGSSTGGTGGTSSFGSHCSSVGGTGGAGTTGVGNGGAGGSATGGDVNVTGSAGGNANSAHAGSGAGSHFGGGGAASGANAGAAGTSGGGGGGGGNASGGAGGDGLVIVEEFY